MDWPALTLSLRLGALTVLILLPIGIFLGRALAWSKIPGRGFVEAMLTLPLVLPPTVLGYYFLVAFGGASPLGQAFHAIFGQTLVFSFSGLLVASVIVNLPFAVQPMQRAFEAIPDELRHAGACCGLRPWQVLLRIDLPLAWPGIVTGLVLTFAHTLGEFGVVLMVGGSIPGETKVISIAIYEQVESLELATAHALAAGLLAFSFVVLVTVYVVNRRINLGPAAREAR